MPLRFALAIGPLAPASQAADDSYARVLHQERNYFGVSCVVQDARRNTHKLIHGNTLHGVQSLDPDRRDEPLTYYHRSGPIGQVFSEFSARPAGLDVAIVGLGAGTLACYAEPGQRLLHEIDPGRAANRV